MMLTINNLTKTYKGGKKAVDQISIQVDDGDIYGFIGHNGAGKSTTIKAVVGVHDFDSGSISIDGVEKYGKALEITEALPDVISSYSHGMKQKLAIISALLHKPGLLVLDEPFVGLDPKAAVALKEIMRELCSQGSAIFFSTHVLEVAEKLCNKIAIIKDGRLICSGNVEDLTKGKSLEEVFMQSVTV